MFEIYESCDCTWFSHLLRPITEEIFSALSAVEDAKSLMLLFSGLILFALNIRDVFSSPFFRCG